MKIVIIGAGFGGIELAKELSEKAQNYKSEIYLVDKNNFHLFQPLLYLLATASVSPSDISTPLRFEFKKYKNIKIIFDELVDIDFKKKIAILSNFQLNFDKLILACGSTTSYFGNDKWEQHSFSLKTLQDARKIRNQVLLNDEMLSQMSLNDNEALKNIVIVGGGPTGVELAGSLSKLSQMNLNSGTKEKPLQKNIFLLERGNKILPTFPDKLSAHATRDLIKLGVQVILNTEVVDINQIGVQFKNNKFLESHCVIWAAGVSAPNINSKFPFKKSIDQRILVDKGLNVIGYKDIYCIGDQACFKDSEGRVLPGLASVAKQQGKQLGRAIKKNRQFIFTYKNLGQMATIGTNRAVADFGFITFSGHFAWIIWSFVHIFMLIGFRNKTLVFLQWMYSYLTFTPSVQIIDEEFSSKTISTLLKKQVYPILLIKYLSNKSQKGVICMMNIKRIIKDISKQEAYPSISLFLEIERSWDKNKLNELRFRELISKVEDDLKNNKQTKEQIEILTAKIKELFYDNLGIDSKGLIFYCNENYIEIIKTDLILESSYHIGKYFDIKPLLQLNSLSAFYILWLNQNNIEFYRVDEGFIEPIHLDKIPNPDEIKTKMSHFEKTLQMHQVGNSTNSNSIRHGHGGSKDYKKIVLDEYCKHVESHVTDYMNKQQKSLVVVGPVQMVGLYRENNHYSQLEEFNANVENNDHIKDVVNDVRAYLEDKWFAKFKEKTNKTWPITLGKKHDNIKKILPLASQGRIQELYVDTKKYCWGEYSKNTKFTINVHQNRRPYSEDLINDMLIETLKYGGQVGLLPPIKEYSDIRALAIQR